MKKLISILALGTLLLSACQTSEPHENPEENTVSADHTVVTSFYPLYFLTNEIVGDSESIEVVNLIPSGAEPHSYEPSPRQLAQMEGADLVVVQGAGLEPWFEGLEDELSASLIVNEGLELMEEDHDEEDDHGHDHGEYDPHTWLDPVLAGQMLELILEQIELIDPENAEKYAANAEALSSRLDILNTSFEEELSSCQHDVIITSHDAFGYLAERYGFHAHPVSGVSPFDEPSAKQIAELIALSEEEGVSHIFFEVLANSEAAEVLAEEAGLTALVLNPISGLTSEQKDDDYFTLMMDNLDNLKTGLACE